MFSKETIQKFSHFIDKPCSFFTVNHQRPLSEQQQVLYFVGFPVEIISDGIFYKSCGNKKLNFINFTHLVAICEEEFVKSTPNKAPDNVADLEKIMAKKSS